MQAIIMLLTKKEFKTISYIDANDYWWLFVIILGHIADYFMWIDDYLRAYCWLFILMDDYLQLFVTILCAWMIVWGHIADYFVWIYKNYTNLCEFIGNKCFNKKKKKFYYYCVV